jgi:hypothetical protein
MRASGFVVALYPPAVRERWGAEIGREIAERGIGTWPDAVAGAVRLWLHPSDWPETVAGQTRRVVAVFLFAATAAAMLLLRAAEPAPYPFVTALWVAPGAAGVLLAAPLPPLRWRVLRIVCAATVRTMLAPAFAVVAMAALANSGAVDHPTGPVRTALVVYYWSTLTFAALRACMLIARVLPVCVVPTTRRLRGALLLVGVGTASASGQSAVLAYHAVVDVGAYCMTAALGLIAALVLHTRQDLHRSIG